MPRKNEYMSAVTSDSLVFVDFYSKWCGPCQKMMPLIDSLKIQYHNKVKIIKVNTDLSKEIIKKMKIQGIPLFVLYRNSQVVYSKYGIIKRNELVNLFDKHLTK